MPRSQNQDTTDDGRWQIEARRLRDLFERRLPVTAFCHENPDGDSIGAAVAMALAARHHGCSVEIVAEALPDTYAVLAAGLKVTNRPTLPAGVAVVCDAATLERIGPVVLECADWLARSVIVSVDHHVTNPRFGAINLVDPEAAASCEVVIALLPELGAPLDSRMATALLAGIVRDSNGFSNEATRAATLRAAATAIDAGASLEPVFRAMLTEMPLSRMRLWGRLLVRVAHDQDRRIVHATLSEGDLAETGTSQHDAEGLAEFLLRASGVKVAVLFRDLGSATRVSVRTVGGVDAAAIVAGFGGGGHRSRAGCVADGPLGETIDALLAAARAELP